MQILSLCVLVSLTLSVSIAEVNSARGESGRPGREDEPFPHFPPITNAPKTIDPTTNAPTNAPTTGLSTSQRRYPTVRSTPCDDSYNYDCITEETAHPHTTNPSTTRPPTTRPTITWPWIQTTHPPTTSPPITRPPTTRPPTTRPPTTRPPTTSPPTTRPTQCDYSFYYDYSHCITEETAHPTTTRPPTTRPPTTRPPTTRPPTARPPTARPPTIHPPTTRPPTTRPPITRPPTTRPPTARPPTTRPPTTRPPTTRPPTTRPPTTRPPTTRPPTTRPPTTRPPTTRPPTTRPPTTRPPTTRPPTTRPPTTRPPTPPTTKPPTSPPTTHPPNPEAHPPTTGQFPVGLTDTDTTVPASGSTAHVTCRGEAKNEGLVHYPTILAPASGSVTVTTQCADNAHIKSGSSLNVTCTSNGSWSGPIPACECDEGHHITTDDDGREICQDDNLVIPLATASGTLLLILALTAIVILATFLHRVSARKRKRTDPTTDPSAMYDKPWVQKKQILKGLSNNVKQSKDTEKKSREDEYDKLNFSNQQHGAKQQRECVISMEMAAQIAEMKKGQEHEKIERCTAEDETSGKVEADLLGNGEGLYDCQVSVSNSKMKKQTNAGDMKGTYDVVVSQLATRKGPEAVAPQVEAYAVCTVPAPIVPHVEAYAVSKVPALSRNATVSTKHEVNKRASEDHAYDLVK